MNNLCFAFSSLLFLGCDPHVQQKSEMSPDQVVKVIKDVGHLDIPRTSIVSTFGKVDDRGTRIYVILFRATDPLPKGISFEEAFPFDRHKSDYDVMQKELALRLGVKKVVKKGHSRVLESDDGVVRRIFMLEFEDGQKHVMLKMIDMR